MLNIQVLGKGLIPRGYGLAPRTKPFKADLNHIGIILQTPGLTINYLNPEDGRLLPLTSKNLKRVWDKYSNWSEKPAAPAAPAGDTVAPEEPPQTPPVEEKNADPEPPKPEVVTPPAPAPVAPAPVPVEPEKPADQNTTPAADTTGTPAPEAEEKPEGDEKPAEEEKKGENSTSPLRPVLSPEEAARRKQQSERDRNRNNGHK